MRQICICMLYICLFNGQNFNIVLNTFYPLHEIYTYIALLERGTFYKYFLYLRTIYLLVNILSNGWFNLIIYIIHPLQVMDLTIYALIQFREWVVCHLHLGNKLYIYIQLQICNFLLFKLAWTTYPLQGTIMMYM